MLDLATPIESLHHVGPRNIPRLKKLGIKTLRDLLWHFPARYDDYRDQTAIADVEPGQKVSIQGEVVKITNRQIFPRHLTITTAIIKDDTGAINAVWFNQPYIATSLTEGTIVSMAGKV
ncbi:TPA: DNA helicase RecG, partial [Candidatus Berkelbacteria bacterium]|nr:DNA helicase RecG [Candidatus Berkelbacteria bacterium]